jgi:peptidyl-prolyl cis-trans isomerase D
MMKFLRSQSQTVLVVILVVIGGSFIFYGNVGNVLTGASRGGGDFGSIGGQDLSVAELYDAVRTTRNALLINNQADQLSQPGGRAQLAQEAWHRLLLLHEADRLHIEVSDHEVADYIRNLPMFQKNGVYDPDLYQAEMGMLESRARITPDAFEKLVRESILVEAVSNALFSTIHAAPGEIGSQFDKYYGSVQLKTIAFDPKTYAATAVVQPSEVEAEYKAHPDNPAYRTPEKRKVDYVLIPLSPEQAKLPEKDKSAALESLGEKALDFALAFQPDPSAGTNGTPPPPPDFQVEAKKHGYTSLTTDFFTADTPPAGLPPSPSFNSAAFSLTQDNPVSKVIELDNGVAVLHLDAIQPSELRPLDQVKAGIEEQLRTVQAAQSAQKEAEKAGQDLQVALAKGTPFDAAAATLKLAVQNVPPFVPAKAPRDDQRQETLAYISAGLEVGTISRPVPIDPTGAIALIYLEKRTPATPADQAEFQSHFREAQDERLRDLVRTDWVNWEELQTGTHRPPNLDEYGGVD